MPAPVPTVPLSPALAGHGEMSNGSVWEPGPGRPSDIPTAATVLNQRSIRRTSLNASVPAELKLQRRLKRFALDKELENLPLGDVVAVAIDEWLEARGY